MKIQAAYVYNTLYNTFILNRNVFQRLCSTENWLFLGFSLVSYLKFEKFKIHQIIVRIMVFYLNSLCILCINPSI